MDNYMLQKQSAQAFEVDNEALAMVTRSLQSLEQLKLRLRASKVCKDEVTDKVCSSLDNLREIKSEIEGSNGSHVATSINEAPLSALRQFLLMHLTSSLTDEVKDKFKDFIHQAFEGKVTKVLSAILVTCPWYAASQRERGEMARHNILLVVYLGNDDQVFSPANPHDHTEGNIIDLGWLQVVELSHFAQQLVKGRTRFVEAVLCDPQSILINSDEWRELTNQLTPSHITSQRGFIAACRGQAVGGITKKRKNGTLKLKDATTFANLCQSCRLLYHLEQLAKGKQLSWTLDEGNMSELAVNAFKTLKSMYQDRGGTKYDFLPLLLSWKDEANASLQKFEFCKLSVAEECVGTWMMKTRLQGRQLHNLSFVEDDHSCLVKLMDLIGGPVKIKDPKQILLIARAGSYMYGLSTPDSDVDYVVIYSEPNDVVMSACRQISECVENRGPNKSFEYGAYEARLFCEMVLKASVVILELIFADGHEYMSQTWKKLLESRSKFVTEKAVQQYLGLIKNNFSMVASGKYKTSGKDRKLFYQIFHKMASVEALSRGVCPSVKCEGELRDYILRVRTQPLEGDLTHEKIHCHAKEKFCTILKNLALRETRLAEKTDYRFMQAWLMVVRGITPNT